MFHQPLLQCHKQLKEIQKMMITILALGDDCILIIIILLTNLLLTVVLSRVDQITW